MRSHVRISLLALVALATLGFAAPSAAQAAFEVEKFAAINCKAGHEACGGEEVTIGPFKYSLPKEPEKAEAEAEGEGQAGARVPFGVTDFKVNTVGELPNLVPASLLTKEGAVSHIRTDIPPGLATNPTATAQCSEGEFGVETLPGSGLFTAPACKAETIIGNNKVTVYLGENGVAPGVSDLPLEGAVYNLVQKEGLSSEWGVALPLPIPLTKAKLEKAFAEHPLPGAEPEKKLTEEALEAKQWFAHTLIEGNVEWGQEAEGTGAGDYHDYFKINVSPELPLISSRLVFFGTTGSGDFITNATRCPGNTTTIVKLTSSTGAVTPPKPYTTPGGIKNCGEVPFEPTLTVTPSAFGHDEPVGFTTEVGLPHNPEAIDSSQLKTAVLTLPEGMTLNPAAAAGLAACTPAQARIHSSTPGTECPQASELGTVELEVPTLPPGSLKGKIYLGGPETGPITGPPYVIYLDAESARYGVSVRLKGETTPNETTGQLTTVFPENPEQPFTTAILHFKGGPLAPIASPLTCGPVSATANLSPFTETGLKSPSSAFTITGCPASIPFSLTQSTANQPASAGANTSFTLGFARENGQQYLSKVSTELPAGMVGLIPTVKLCEEPQANAGTCSSLSQIGNAVVEAGAGPTPYKFVGPVYLTGPYQGAPYGLSVAVPAVAGPFNLGTVVTRATINVNPYTARVMVTSNVPTIVKGIPLRMRNLTVTINRQGYLRNPTNCAPLFTESTLTSTFGASQLLKTPFQVANCNALAFKPSFSAASLAKTSKANGASLETTINQPSGQANIASVRVQLPSQLPSRLTTLQKACLQKTFENDPYNCPAGAFVGGARANTPVLPGKLQGPAILVSHGGAAFPDLDLVMEANGVRVILVGNTDIKKAITTTTFAATPDVPVSSVTVNLPTGPHSALAANGSLCRNPLIMPTTITAQNGKQIKQNTKINVKNCPVEIVGQKVVGDKVILKVETSAAGRISGSGPDLSTVYRHFNGAQSKATLEVPLSSSGRERGRPFRVEVRVGFIPKKSGSHSIAYTNATFF